MSVEHEPVVHVRLPPTFDRENEVYNFQWPRLYDIEAEVSNYVETFSAASDIENFWCRVG
jgi:hypothetical protein